MSKQIFPKWTNFLPVIILVSLTVILGVTVHLFWYWFSPKHLNVGYQPKQPIPFSHSLHVSKVGLDCRYCHSNVEKAAHSNIPTTETCMNCHKNIAEYNGEEDLENGYTKEFYTKEIKKLYAAVGWDEDNQAYTGKSQPVKWVRIHNLPDFVYFNHAQHVQVGGIECQTCHGPVEEMEVMYQHSSLTMGWCINCHRETNVKVQDNEYYAKIHEQLSKKYGVEKLTVAQMGGLECGKCHY